MLGDHDDRSIYSSFKWPQPNQSWSATAELVGIRSFLHLPKHPAKPPFCCQDSINHSPRRVLQITNKSIGLPVLQRDVISALHPPAASAMSAPVALVTASSAGLGAATARGLARAGFSLAINYNSSKHKADEVLNEMRRIYDENRNGVTSAAQAAPFRCIAIQADVSRREDMKCLVQETMNSLGRIDCVVSNQGWTQVRQFDNLDENIEEIDWDTCYNMNVKSHLYLFHAVRPYLVASRGSFTTVASLAGVIPSGSSIVSLPATNNDKRIY